MVGRAPPTKANAPDECTSTCKCRCVNVAVARAPNLPDGRLLPQYLGFPRPGNGRAGKGKEAKERSRGAANEGEGMGGEGRGDEKQEERGR